jgi:Na+/H+-dicarboxylate symporter
LKVKLASPTWILAGLVAGTATGLVLHRIGASEAVTQGLGAVGTAFIRLIRMVVIPLVFVSLVVGITSLGDVRKLGRIGLKTLVYYFCTTTVAVALGLALANAFKPGQGLSPSARTKLTELAPSGGPASFDPARPAPSLTDLLVNTIPTNPLASAVQGHMLQIIFFAVIMGICLTLIPRANARPVMDLFETLNQVFMKMVRLIMLTAPLGVFALITVTVAQSGWEILQALLRYALVVVTGLGLHTVLVYSCTVKWLARRPARSFFRALRPAQLIAFSTSSSSATLPVTMDCVEQGLGVSREVCSFTLPLGATINMDGTALYQGVSAVFIAQLYGIDLGLGAQLTIVITAVLSSIGTAGTPAAALMTLAIILTSCGLPLEGIALISGVERILDMCRSVVNITGDASCAVVVDASENRPQ